MYYAITKAKESLQADLEVAFDLSIDNDLELRFKKVVNFYVVSLPQSRKQRSAGKLINEKESRYVKIDTSVSYSFMDEEKRYQQTILLDSNPISPAILNGFFQKELLKKKIPAETAVIVHDGKVNKQVLSLTDSTLYRSAFKAGPFKLGLFKEIEVTAYAAIPWWYLSMQILQQPLTLGILAAMLMTYTLWLIIAKRKRISQARIDFSDLHLTTSIYSLGRLSLDTETQTVFSGTEKIKVTGRDYQLLLLFLTGYNHYVSREKIIQHFWSEKEDCTDRINTSVSRLRRILKDADPSLKIVAEKKAGYRLTEKK